ncbi:cation diffusion facilitator family transporter [Calorimonas adulescens]|uniref:Cation transporter n=1 Tax=Calorimonas adulescens TaxID=2606906 RepID=A0A5D8QHV3_9THEO|nr:cation diffusion facilitator family transporter [Calorimonas adulescens]TZE82878.1 cation transporter [Calorimonas adulescens]
MEEANYRELLKVNVVVLLLNLLVCIAKIVVGNAINSISMVADGYHSLTDMGNNIIGIVGINFAYRPSDEKHPYGHKKIETMVTLIIAAALLVLCYEVTIGAIKRFKQPVAVDTNLYSILVMAATILINIFVAMYEKKKADTLKSDFLASDSIHTTSDVLVSVSVIVGLILSRYGLSIADVIISIFIVIMIGRAAFEILSKSTGVLMDSVVLDEKDIERLVLSVDGVKSCHKIRTRGREDDIKVDLHVLVGNDMNVYDAHEISEVIEERLRGKFPGITDVTIHIEPESNDKQS